MKVGTSGNFYIKFLFKIINFLYNNTVYYVSKRKKKNNKKVAGDDATKYFIIKIILNCEKMTKEKLNYKFVYMEIPFFF